MFKGIFTDSDLLYRIDVVNSVDFYAMGFDVMRGETYARNALQWPLQERTDVLIVNVRLEDMSGFELAERIRRQMPQVKVIFLADSPDGADAQTAVRFGAFDYLLKSTGIDALRRAIDRAIGQLNAEHRETAYIHAQSDWDEVIPQLLRLLSALKQEQDADHWRAYSGVRPLLSGSTFSAEALFAQALMEELRWQIRCRDETLIPQIRDSMMNSPLDTLTSAQGTAACVDAIWTLLCEKGYLTQEDALKSDTIGRACVYMHAHLGEKLTAQSVAAYAHISSRHFVRKFRAEMNETFADYLLRIRIQAAIGMLKNGKDIKSIPEAVGYKDKKSFCAAFKDYTGCSMREYQQKLNLSQRKEKQP